MSSLQRTYSLTRPGPCMQSKSKYYLVGHAYTLKNFHKITYYVIAPKYMRCLVRTPEWGGHAPSSQKKKKMTAGGGVGEGWDRLLGCTRPRPTATLSGQSAHRLGKAGGSAQFSICTSQHVTWVFAFPSQKMAASLEEAPTSSRGEDFRGSKRQTRRGGGLHVGEGTRPASGPARDPAVLGSRWRPSPSAQAWLP